MFLRLLASAALAVSLVNLSLANPAHEGVPTPNREFRAAWVATVANIDWPSARNLTVEQQKAEMIQILDKAKALNLNAIIFQVRPACDALYPSEFEPWSDVLTGRQGVAPSPFYDPLKFTIEESHKRAIELHAWINPYRAHHPTTKGPLADNHISKTDPKMVAKYGKYLWLDPGRKEVQDHTIKVMMDIVRRYDVDGMHFDDYFYPYREKDETGREIDFPDEEPWMQFVAEGGTITRDDWRRQNVNALIERAYKEIKAEKPWVKFGVSPFGIWQPGFPREIRGMNAYEQIYCDSKRWLNEGWVDYVAPQLYWKIEAPAQSYPVLLKWWVEQNTHGRHIWVGNFTSRVPEQWQPAEIINQIQATRSQEGASGNIHFSMKPLLRQTELGNQLAREVYSRPALIPGMTWVNSTKPAAPSAVKLNKSSTVVEVAWQPASNEKVWQWAVQKRVEGEWVLEVLPGSATSVSFPSDNRKNIPDLVAIAAVNRYGLLGPAVAQKVQ